MKIKCISNYNHNGNTGILQVFYNNSLIAKYSRLRLYKGINPETKKPDFDWIRVPVNAEIQTLLKQQLDQMPLVQAIPKPNVVQNSNNSSPNPKLSKFGAFGGIWTRDHYLTKVTPHRARLRRHFLVFSVKECVWK